MKGCIKLSYNLVYLNTTFNRSVDTLLGTRATFITAGGIFTGTISAIDQNTAYELQNVTFRPTGAFNVKIKMKICEIYGNHIIASIPELDAEE